MYVPLSTASSLRGPRNPWELMRRGNLDPWTAPGAGVGYAHALNPRLPVRVAGVGEIMDGLPLGMGMGGLGAGTGQQLALSVPSMAAGIVLAPGVVAGTGASSTLAGSLLGAAAVPIIGAAVAAVTIALMLIFSRKGPKQRTESTAIVNQVQGYLEQNLQAYMSGPRTRSSQQQALNNFDAGWALLVSDQGCGNPLLGAPGRACIEQRQRGGNIGKPGSDHGDWCTAPEGCDMFVSLRDPIANDPNVVPDPVEGEAVGGTATVDAQGNVVRVPTTGAVTGGGSGVLLLAAAALAVVAFMGEN